MVRNKKYLKRSYSKNVLTNYSTATNAPTVFPNFSTEKVNAMVDSDPVARGAVNHFIDKFMEGNFNVVKRESHEYDSEFEDLLYSKYKFRTEVLRKCALQLKYYNNAFVEIVRDTEGKTKSLNVLDTYTIEAITAPNGDPIKYESKIPDPNTGEKPSWDKKDIVWMKMGDRSVGYAPLDFKALYENLLSKEYVKRYVAWLWKTGQYRLIYSFKPGTRDPDIQSWMAYNRKHENNFSAPFIAKGELETKILRDMGETESIERLLKYYDSQTLILLRISPIDVGIPDASGRSNADAQSNSLGTTITSIKKLVQDYVNDELFPKMNKGNNLILFAPNDRFSEKQVFENIQIMKSINMTDEVVQEYLLDRGMVYKSKLFKEEPTMETIANPRDLDMAPSRSGKGEGEANKKVGTGSEGTTRDDQL